MTMTTTNEALIAEARKREAEWGSRDSLPSDVWLVVRLADALAAVPAPTEADRETLAKALYVAKRARAGVQGTLTWESDAEWKRDEFRQIADDALATDLVSAPKTQDGEAREALAKMLAEHVWPDLRWESVKAHCDFGIFYERADAILARYTLVPVTPEPTPVFEAMGLPPLPPFPSIHPEGGE